MNNHEEREEYADERDRIERGFYLPFPSVDPDPRPTSERFGDWCRSMRAGVISRHPHLASPSDRMAAAKGDAAHEQKTGEENRL